MSPVVSLLISVIALLLAIGAILLATIANRRWARGGRSSLADERARGASAGVGPPVDSRRPGPAPWDASEPDPRELALAELRDHLDTLGLRVADLRDRVADLRVDTDGVRARADVLRTTVERIQAEPGHDPNALRHVALVRYDAFADVGGRLSYSVALLDDTRSGLVLTTLAGKSDVRTYVRTVSGGEAEGTLTAEEQQAIEAATAPGE